MTMLPKPATSRPALAVVPASGSLHEPRGPDDHEIARALGSGEAWAADALYARVERVVDRVLCRVLQRRSADHMDLFQETFERLIASLVSGSFRGQCSLATWAASIASNVAVDAIRARVRGKRITLSEFEEPADGYSLESRIEARSDVACVESAIAAMNPGRAEVVVLFDLLGHSLTEVAEFTGLSVAAAQSRLVRGREELRLRLAAEGLGGR